LGLPINVFRYRKTRGCSRSVLDADSRLPFNIETVRPSLHILAASRRPVGFWLTPESWWRSWAS
jgi:hypothetical protein